MGIKQIIISTGKNPVVLMRAAKLDIRCFQGIKNKKDTLINFCRENIINMNEVAFVGNDINDKDGFQLIREKVSEIYNVLD